MNDPELRETFLGRLLPAAIEDLAPDARARWGAMSAQQMVEHVAWVFEVSTGRATVPCTVPERRRERWKAFLYDDTPMLQHIRNPALVDGLPGLRHPGLAQARAALSVEAERFLEQCRSAPGAVHTHPVLGPLDNDQWSRSHFKHGYHHLLQFGLIAE